MALTNKEVLEIYSTQQYYLKKVAKKWNNELVLKNLARNIRSKIK
jgi:hypothetical protein